MNIYQQPTGLTARAAMRTIASERAHYDGTSEFVDAGLMQKRHGRIAFPRGLSYPRQSDVIRDVARELGRQQAILPKAVLILRAGVALQGFEDQPDNYNPSFVDKLETFRAEFGKRALIGLIGLDYSRSFKEGAPAALETLAEIMTDEETPFTCQIGSKAISPLSPDDRQKLTDAQLVVSEPAAQFTLSSRSRWGNVLISIPPQGPRLGTEEVRAWVPQDFTQL